MMVPYCFIIPTNNNPDYEAKHTFLTRGQKRITMHREQMFGGANYGEIIC